MNFGAGVFAAQGVALYRMRGATLLLRTYIYIYIFLVDAKNDGVTWQKAKGVSWMTGGVRKSSLV